MSTKTKTMNQKNNLLDKKLNAENITAMTDIVCYVRGANISDYNQEVVRQDLLEMILHAQERGENVKKVIGEDYKLFCDEVIAALPQKTKKEQILDFLNSILLCTSILGAINIVISKETILLIRNIVTGQPLNFQISFTVSSLLSYFLILAAAFLIVHVILKSSLKPEKKEKQSKLKTFLIGGSIGGSIMAIFLIIAWVGKQTLFTVNLFAACVFVLVLFIAHKLLVKMNNTL